MEKRKPWKRKRIRNEEAVERIESWKKERSQWQSKGNTIERETRCPKAVCGHRFPCPAVDFVLFVFSRFFM